MALRRYLLICFAATFGMVFPALVLMPKEEPVPIGTVLIVSLVIACINMFVQSSRSLLPQFRLSNGRVSGPTSGRTPCFWAFRQGSSSSV